MGTPKACIINKSFFLLSGVGNLAVTAAVDLACIPFPKMKRFAYILNLPFIEKTTYYRLRGIYI